MAKTIDINNLNIAKTPCFFNIFPIIDKSKHIPETKQAIPKIKLVLIGKYTLCKSSYFK